MTKYSMPCCTVSIVSAMVLNFDLNNVSLSFYPSIYLFLFQLQALSEMTELLSSSSNYSNYRRVYSECTGFKVPILGVHLKDLISLNEALPDYLEADKINLGKLQHLYSNISELLAIHECKIPFVPNKDLLPLLTVSCAQTAC